MAINVAATAHLIAMVDPLLNQSEHGQALFFDDPRAAEKLFGAYGASKAAQIALAKSRPEGCNLVVIVPQMCCRHQIGEARGFSAQKT